MSAVQTSYALKQTAAYAGMVADGCHPDIEAAFNEEASAEIAFGRAVKYGVADNGALLPTAETSKIRGIVTHSHAYSNGPYGDLGTTGVKAGGVLNVMRKGRIWVVAEDAVVPGDRLWVRAVAGGDPEFLGGLTNADDSTDTIDCTNVGVWRTTAAAGALAILEVDFTNAPA